MPTADGRLSNGILLNGVWRDYYDIIVSANELERHSSEMMGFLGEDRDSMAAERSILLQKWRQNMSSLTNVETNHLEAQEILEQIRIEKYGLEMRCSSLETQRDWLDRQRHELRGVLTSMSQATDALEMKLKEEENQLRIEKSENNCLLEITYKRESTIESLEKKLSKYEEENDVLQRSLSTKDRQFQTLLKERNRLKDELETAMKDLARGKRSYRQSQAANYSKPLTAAFTPPSPQSISLNQLMSNRSPISPEACTDDEHTFTPVDESHAPDDRNMFNSPISLSKSCASLNNGNQDVASSGFLIRNLHISDYNETQMVPENEPNFEIRDKIYRSVIKKLQNELNAARNATQKNSAPPRAASSAKIPSFRITKK